MGKPVASAEHIECRRRDRLTAQRIDVGLVFLEMLGSVEAAVYLARSEVSPDIARRVLAVGGERRAGGDCWLNNDYIAVDSL
jgi:hypothetical protein